MFALRSTSACGYLVKWKPLPYQLPCITTHLTSSNQINRPIFWPTRNHVSRPSKSYSEANSLTAPEWPHSSAPLVDTMSPYTTLADTATFMLILPAAIPLSAERINVKCVTLSTIWSTLQCYDMLLWRTPKTDQSSPAAQHGSTSRTLALNYVELKPTCTKELDRAENKLISVTSSVTCRPPLLRVTAF